MYLPFVPLGVSMGLSCVSRTRSKIVVVSRRSFSFSSSEWEAYSLFYAISVFCVGMAKRKVFIPERK